MFASNTNKIQQRQTQRRAARSLLDFCLQNHFPDSFLDESDFPYRLVDRTTKPKHYLSFSHSGDRVALIVADRPCGIDVETRSIDAKVADRFFHANEKNWLDRLSDAKKAQGRRLLWQIKESAAKANASALSQTLAMDFSRIAAKALKGKGGGLVSCNALGSAFLYQSTDRQNGWLALVVQ